jgi:uncharacterized protein YukE
VPVAPPTYPAHMQPLAFPTAATQSAATACRSMARLVDEKVGAASTAAGAATPTWSGAYADDFDIAWPDTELSATELSERLRRLAGELEAAITAAADENTRREGLRSQYDCEHAGPNVPC